MKLHFQFEECHNEELINFVKNAKNDEEVLNYTDEHNISNWELIDAFFTLCRDKNTITFYENGWMNALCDTLDEYLWEDVSNFYKEDRSKFEL